MIKRIKNQINRWRLYRDTKDILAGNKILKDSKRGQRCFIIGTGPSIKNQDLLKLRDEETFTVNSFWNHPQYKEINPKYHVLIDRETFRESEKGGAMRDELFLKNNVLRGMPTVLFFHISGREFVIRNKLFGNNRIYYLAFFGNFRENQKYNIDLDKVLPNMKNVIVSAIIIAAYMGYGEIYLLGCEHDFLAHTNFYKGFEHFYENRNFDQKDPVEIERYSLDIMPYEQHIHHVGQLFRNYRLLKDKLKKERPELKVFNATPNSFLDVFPAIDFKDIKK